MIKEVTLVANKVSKIILPDIKLHSKKKNDVVANLSLNGVQIVLQTPFLELASDLIKTEHSNIYKIDLLLEGPNKNKTNEFIIFIEKLEAHICNLVKQEYSCWFSEEKIVQQSMVSMSSLTNKNYLGLPLVINDCFIYDSDGVNIDPSANIMGKNAKLIIEISHLWIKNNQFGFVTNVKKIIIQKPLIKIVTDYLFDESDDDSDRTLDKNTENLVSLVSDKPSNNKNKTSPPYLVELVTELDKKEKNKKKQHDRTKSTTDEKNIVLLNSSNEHIGKINYKKRVEYLTNDDIVYDFDKDEDRLYESDN